MGRGSELGRYQRLEQLIGLLRSQDFWTVTQLAQKLHVTPRTLMRDLDLLRERGYPVETERGRGGGLRLHGMWGVGRLLLSYRETIDLLLSLAVLAKLGSPFLLSQMRSLRHKIASSFPESQKARIAGLRQRIFIGAPAGTTVLQNYQAPSKNKAMDELIQAFFESKRLDIVYEDEKKRKTERCIEPHYLFLNWPVWYIVAWDHLRDDARVFRLDRMQQAKVRTETFRKHHEEELLKSLENFGSPL